MSRLSFRLALALLLACCGRAEREAITGDICEMYNGKASFRLWREVLSSAPPLAARRFVRTYHERDSAAIALGVLAGCIAIIAVQAITGDIVRALYPSAENFDWPRVADSIVALAIGSCVTARIARRCVDKSTLALGCTALIVTLSFLIPVMTDIYEAGPFAIFYHVLLIAIIAPSIAAGAFLSAYRATADPAEGMRGE